jgi:hypothetical protein
MTKLDAVSFGPLQFTGMMKGQVVNFGCKWVGQTHPEAKKFGESSGNKL